MIKLSKLTDYAVVLLGHLYLEPAKSLSAAQLSEVSKIPLPTVSKILKILGASKLIESIRGSNGGYQLIDREVSLKDIIEVMEGPIAITACADGEQKTECSMERSCIAHGRWTPVNEAIKIALEEVHLSDMVAGHYKKTNEKVA